MKKLEGQVEKLAESAVKAKTSHEAMQYAQAALSVAHAYATWRGAEQLK